MRLIKKCSVVLALTLLAAVPALGQAEFTFEGFAAYVPTAEMVGTSMTVYGIANAPVSAPTPVPTDFNNFQYTIMIGPMVSTAYAFNMGLANKHWVFGPGMLAIFEDPIAGGTAADYANPATFTDGVMIVQAAIDPGWFMDLDNPIGFGYSGAGIGTCDIVGGSQYAFLDMLNYNLNNWTFAGTGIAEPWPPFISVPPGYEHVFGSKVIFNTEPTANENLSWGQVKSLY